MRPHWQRAGSFSFNFDQNNLLQEDFSALAPILLPGIERVIDSKRQSIPEESSSTHSKAGTGRAGSNLQQRRPRYGPRYPSTEEVFKGDTTPGLDQPHHTYAGAFAKYDFRDHPGNPRSGGCIDRRRLSRPQSEPTAVDGQSRLSNTFHS